MKKWNEIWREQAEQQKLWYDQKSLTQSEKDTILKDLLLGIHEEIGELQRLLDRSRYHIMKRESPDQDAVAEAGVDVFKYLVSLMLLGGVTSRRFVEEFGRKSELVKRKTDWQREDLSGLTVLLCDLDGCVADWCGSFRHWAAEHGHVIEPGNINAPHLEPLKDEFASCGKFRELAPFPDSIGVLRDWRERAESHRIVVVTARPYKRHRRLYADTIEWCNAVGMLYDHILFEHDKAEAVRQVQPATVVALIEDRGKHALEVAATGVSVFKLPYEAEETVVHPNIRHVASWTEISQGLCELQDETGLENKETT